MVLAQRPGYKPLGTVWDVKTSPRGRAEAFWWDAAVSSISVEFAAVQLLSGAQECLQVSIIHEFYIHKKERGVCGRLQDSTDHFNNLFWHCEYNIPVFHPGCCCRAEQLAVELQFGFFSIILVKLLHVLERLPELFDKLS